MDISVRYVRPPGHGMKPALCFRGRKIVRCVINDERSIRVKEVTLRMYDTASFVNDHGHPYAVEKFISHMERISTIKPTTQAALKLMERARAGLEIDDEDLPPEDAEESPHHPEPSTPQASRASVSGLSQSAEKKVPTAQGPSVIAAIAAERRMEATKIRRLLRAAGLHAPYEDRAAILAALG